MILFFIQILFCIRQQGVERIYYVNLNIMVSLRSKTFYDHGNH